MKRNTKLLTALLFFAVSFIYAALPPQPVPPSGGQGGTGTGAAASPIDMYVYVLALIAVLMIAFIAKKYKTQKI